MKRFFCAIFVLLLVCPVMAVLPQEKQKAVESINRRAEDFAKISKLIWQWAELGYVETRSSKLLQKTLQDEGFSIESGIAGMPTAFEASFGKGKPVICLLAEFDALPGMSQDICTDKKEQVSGAPGHGCGHNLLGTGCVAAAIAVKDWLNETGKQGTIKVFGCPAEEGGQGKKYIAGAGFFGDADVAFTWHPAGINGCDSHMTIGAYIATFKFYGVTSHASTAPHNGRSAMDAVEALNFMANLMREHVRPDTRIYYKIMAAKSESFLPDYAEVQYGMRSHDLDYLAEVAERIKKAAEGAAMGTGTRVECDIYPGNVPTVLNKTVSQLTYKNLRSLEPIKLTDQETELLKNLSSQYEPGRENFIKPYVHGARNFGASDVGFVSRMVPTVWLHSFCWPNGTDPHTWQAVVSSGSSTGQKGMLQAAKAIAVTCIDIYNEPSIVEKAKAELVEARGTDAKYVPDTSRPAELDMYKDSVNRQY